MAKKALILRPLLVLALLLAGCQNARPRATNNATSNSTVLVFAAASLTDAFQELGTVFHESHPDSEIRFNFGGSQQLAQQIVAGAPGDVFASADLAQLRLAIAAGIESQPAGTDVHNFAANRLIIVYPPESLSPIESIHDLTQPGLRLVIAAEEVPAGHYTQRFLDNAATELGPAYRRQVMANVVSYELNVRAVLTKVTLGEADAGIVYSSDTYAARSSQIGRLPIPGALNVVAHYYLAPLAAPEDNPLAREFVEYVLSNEGQVILQRYGFAPPVDPASE